MSSPSFPQPARRNLLAPVLIAFLVLGIFIALVIRYTPHKTADLNILSTSVYAAHTVFDGDTIVVGRGNSQDDLYVVTTLRVQDRLNLPIFIKDFTATLTTADGEEITTNAAEKQEIPTLYTAFPALKPLGSEPLLRETFIAPGSSAQGMVLLHFPATQDIWDHRKSAVLNVDLYHQGPIAVTIPQSTETSRPGSASK